MSWYCFMDVHLTIMQLINNSYKPLSSQKSKTKVVDPWSGMLQVNRRIFSSLLLTGNRTCSMRPFYSLLFLSSWHSLATAFLTVQQSSKRIFHTSSPRLLGSTIRSDESEIVTRNFITNIIEDDIKENKVWCILFFAIYSAIILQWFSLSCLFNFNNFGERLMMSRHRCHYPDCSPLSCFSTCLLRTGIFQNDVHVPELLHFIQSLLLRSPLNCVTISCHVKLIYIWDHDHDMIEVITSNNSSIAPNESMWDNASHLISLESVVVLIRIMLQYHRYSHVIPITLSLTMWRTAV